jgi:hypothetical protein
VHADVVGTDHHTQGTERQGKENQQNTECCGRCSATLRLPLCGVGSLEFIVLHCESFTAQTPRRRPRNVSEGLACAQHKGPGGLLGVRVSPCILACCKHTWNATVVRGIFLLCLRSHLFEQLFDTVVSFFSTAEDCILDFLMSSASSAVVSSRAGTQLLQGASEVSAALAGFANKQARALDTKMESSAVHHSLYTGASVSTPSRISLSVRCNDLLSAAWFAEATTLVALFAIDPDSKETKYTLVSQTEFVKENNAPVFNTQFLLERNIGGKTSRRNYMLRIYDVESEVIDESKYLGLATFDLEELLANTRAYAGGFVSVELPLVHPTNKSLHEQLESSHSTVTVSLHVPAEISSDPAVPVSPVSQQKHSNQVYTRLINQLAPNINTTNMELRVELDGAASGSGGQIWTSVWYRPRATGMWKYIGYIENSGAAAAGSIDRDTVLVVSDELYNSEVAANGGDDDDSGFELKFLVLDSAALASSTPGGRLALETARGCERAAGRFANPEVGASAGALVKDPAFLGATTVAFKEVIANKDGEEMQRMQAKR